MSSLEARIGKLWAVFGAHKARLRRYAKAGQDAAKPIEQKAYDAFLMACRAIHPDIHPVLYWAEQRGGPLVHFPFEGKPHLFILQHCLLSSERARYPRSWTFVNGTPCRAIIEGRLSAGEKPLLDTWIKISYTPEVELHLYNQGVDLNIPEQFQRIKRILSALLGEAFIEIYVGRLVVCDTKPDDAQPLGTLYEEGGTISGRLVSEILSYTPFKMPSKYEATLGAKDERVYGVIGFPFLLDEFPPRVGSAVDDMPSREYITALKDSGLGVYSLRVQAAGVDRRQVFRSMSNLISYVLVDAPCGVYSIGRAEGGLLADLYYYDLVITDPEIFIQSLREKSRGYPYALSLLDNTSMAEDRLQVIHTLEGLDVEELYRIGASPSEVLAAIARSPRVRQESLELQLIKGEMLIRLDRCEEAVVVLEGCLEQKPDEIRALTFLAQAYQIIREEEAASPPYYPLKRKALSCYERMIGQISADAAGAAYLDMAIICFAYNLMNDEDQSYERGHYYVQQARRSRKLISSIKRAIYRRTHALTLREQRLLSQVYRSRFGQPEETRVMLTDEGQRYKVHLYAASPLTRGCHVLITEGISSTLLEGTRFSTRNRTGARLEFMVALPGDMPIERILARGHRHWYLEITEGLNKACIHSPGELRYLDLERIVEADNMGESPLPGSNVYLLRLNPRNIYKRSSAVQPIVEVASEPIWFIGITPLHVSEHQYTLLHTEPEIRRSGLYKISPIYDPVRPSLLEEVSLDDIDPSAWLNLGGMPGGFVDS